MSIQGLTKEQTAMLKFALRWQPYGGGDPGDILVEFGLTEKDYFARLSNLLAIHALATGLEPPTLAAMQATCRLRLARAYASGTTSP